MTVLPRRARGRSFVVVGLVPGVFEVSLLSSQLLEELLGLLLRLVALRLADLLERRLDVLGHLFGRPARHQQTDSLIGIDTNDDGGDGGGDLLSVVAGRYPDT